MSERECLSIEEAAYEVKLVSRRLALLHLAFARTAVRRLGEAEGRRFILSAIKEYGSIVGEEVRREVERQGLPTEPQNYGAGTARALPRWGMHEEGETVSVDCEERLRAFGCAMAKVWHEYGDDDLGRLYCYVDPAKYMAYNPKYTMAHTKAMPDGDPYCEFCIRPTSQEERDAFRHDRDEWTSADRRIETS